MGKSVTMRDVAAALGISTVSVSNALSGKQGVSSSVRDEIALKAREMGYVYEPRMAAGAVPSSPSLAAAAPLECKIAVLAADRFLDGDSYYATLYAMLSMECAKSNMITSLEVLPAADEDALKLPAFLQDKWLTAFIVLGQLSHPYIKALRDSDKPYIFLDFYDTQDTSDAIVCDSMYGSYLLTDYLIKMGHRDIGFLGNVKATPSIMDRYLGFHCVIIRNNLVTRAECIVMDRDNSSASRIFDTFSLPKKLPTAFVCNCDDSALRLVRQLSRMSIKVSDDVSVVGYDNHITATICDPPLTTFAVDRCALVKDAVKAIKEKIANPAVTVCRKIVGGQVVYRQSVKDIR